MAKHPKNIGASVRARLLSLAQKNGQTFELVLIRFALERLLYRMSQSLHAVRRGNQGARAASIRMRMRRGWADGGRA